MVDRTPGMDDRFCSAFTTWIGSGPRNESDIRDLEIFRGPNDPDAVTMWSLGYSAKCEDNDCLDAYDGEFVDEVGPLSHYWWTNEFATNAASCVGAKPKLEIEISDDDQSAVSATKKTLAFCDD